MYEGDAGFLPIAFPLRFGCSCYPYFPAWVGRNQVQLYGVGHDGREKGEVVPDRLGGELRVLVSPLVAYTFFRKLINKRLDIPV